MTTYTDALDNATRLLQFAEDETDLARLDAYRLLADGWLNVAGLIDQHQTA